MFIDFSAHREKKAIAGQRRILRRKAARVGPGARGSPSRTGMTSDTRLNTRAHDLLHRLPVGCAPGVPFGDEPSESPVRAFQRRIRAVCTPRYSVPALSG